MGRGLAARPQNPAPAQPLAIHASAPRASPLTRNRIRLGPFQHDGYIRLCVYACNTTCVYAARNIRCISPNTSPFLCRSHSSPNPAVAVFVNFVASVLTSIQNSFYHCHLHCSLQARSSLYHSLPKSQITRPFRFKTQFHASNTLILLSIYIIFSRRHFCRV